MKYCKIFSKYLLVQEDESFKREKSDDPLREG